jgi:predicted methyltransferase
MHRTKEVDPLSDAQSKIDAIKPVSGRVLDTCTGLGYTAIKARSAGADEVYTIEEDEGMMMLCELNPWSSEIFDERIRKIRGSTLEDVKKFKDEFFSAVIHDPPRFGLAGKLYSTEFYRELHRILKEGGKLFHYVGSPGGKYRSRDLPSGVMKRLKDAGFQNIKKQNQALGITARKK